MASRTTMEEIWDACDDGNASRVRELFKSLDLKPNDAQMYLDDLLIDNHHPNTEVIRVLFDNGASAAEICLRWIRNCHSVEVLRLLAENGMEFKDTGHEILEDVVHSREVIDFLLDQGVDINRPDERRSITELPYRARPGPLFDRTLGVLNNAAALGDTDLFDYLVSRGADVSKSIALHHAARCEDPIKTRAMISHLVDRYGFDVNADDNAAGLRDLGTLGSPPYYKGVPMNFAILFKNIAAVEELLRRGADITLEKYCLLWNAMSDFPAAIKPFLDGGADANKALSEAVRLNNRGIARLCLKYGADPNTVLDGATGDPARGISQEMLALLNSQ